MGIEDSGHVAVRGIKDDQELEMTLALVHRVNAAECRWSASGRSIKFLFTKAQYEEWDRLVVGDKPFYIRIDWSNYMSEEEENEIRTNPFGHDVYHMRAAMGKGWNTSLNSHMAARQQAAAVDTYNPDEEEEDITL